MSLVHLEITTSSPLTTISSFGILNNLSTQNPTGLSNALTTISGFSVVNLPATSDTYQVVLRIGGSDNTQHRIKLVDINYMIELLP